MRRAFVLMMRSVSINCRDFDDEECEHQHPKKKQAGPAQVGAGAAGRPVRPALRCRRQDRPAVQFVIPRVA
jgi:hypothetical protein